MPCWATWWAAARDVYKRQHQDIDLAVQQLLPYPRKRGLVHTAVGRGDARAGQKLRQLCRTLVDGIDAVVDIIRLAAAVQLAPQGLGHHARVVFHHIGLDGAALKGRLFDGAHVPQLSLIHI